MTSTAAEHFGEECATDETISEQRAGAVGSPGPVDLDELIGELDDAFDRLPEETLRACQANRELVTPRLIEVLQEAVRAGQQGEVRDGNAPIFALFLLAEFEAMEALPVVIDFVKLPGAIPETFLGDAITEDLPRFLALFARDRSELLDDLIGDRQVNEWVRWEAVNAVIYLVRDGRLTRETAIERLTGHLVHAMGEKDEWITGPLILVLLKLNANEARSEIERAYHERLVDESLVGMESVDEELRPEQPGISNDLECHSPTKVSDTVAEMRNWIWSEEEDGDEHDDDGEEDDEWLRREEVVDPAALVRELAGDDFPSPYEPSTIRSNAAHVGRNDPCPCGSGKKYKKCCLRS